MFADVAVPSVYVGNMQQQQRRRFQCWSLLLYLPIPRDYTAIASLALRLHARSKDRVEDNFFDAIIVTRRSRNVPTAIVVPAPCSRRNARGK